jgi:hypothetical protein
MNILEAIEQGRTYNVGIRRDVWHINCVAWEDVDRLLVMADTSSLPFQTRPVRTGIEDLTANDWSPSLRLTWTGEPTIKIPQRETKGYTILIPPTPHLNDEEREQMVELVKKMAADMVAKKETANA